VEKPYPRVTQGAEELRVLASGQRAISPTYSSGDVFFGTDRPLLQYATSGRGPTPIPSGQKLGYVMWGDPSGMTAPDPSRVSAKWGQTGHVDYSKQGYVVSRGGVNPEQIKQIQRIKSGGFTERPLIGFGGANLGTLPSANEPILGTPRDFARFQKKYEGISQAAKARSAFEMGRDLRPAAKSLERALGGAVLRGAGRLAGPVGVAMTAYDLAQAFPAPAPISEEDMGKALRSYRTGPQPAY
jgi:hypothetical protein